MLKKPYNNNDNNKLNLMFNLDEVRKKNGYYRMQQGIRMVYKKKQIPFRTIRFQHRAVGVIKLTINFTFSFVFQKSYKWKKNWGEKSLVKEFGRNKFAGDT